MKTAWCTHHLCRRLNRYVQVPTGGVVYAHAHQRVPVVNTRHGENNVHGPPCHRSNYKYQVRDREQAMTNPIARRPGLVKCDQIYIRASKFSDKNTICTCIISGLVTFWIPNLGLVHFKIICQALESSALCK
jgi:hypothetical protein